MAIRNRPAPDLRGLYRVKSPYELNSGTLHTCVGLHKFTDLIRHGYNVYGIYYKPYGIEESVYETDLREGGWIVTLHGDDGSVLALPDSYILDYPNMSLPPYAMYILSMKLGPFRNDYDFIFLKEKIKEVVSDTTGVEPEVFTDVLTNNSVLTREEADALEVSRTAAIKNRDTTYALLQKSEADNQILRETIDSLLEQIEKK